MRRIAAVMLFVLALFGAGGFAAAEGAATLPPVRRILNISLSVKPAELVVPGDVTLTFTIANASEYDAENLYIASSDGLHIEPLGQIDAGESKMFNRQHTVSAAELDEGLIKYTLSHDGIAGDRETVNYAVECPIEKAIAQPGVEFTRQFTGTFVRMGDVVTITYRVRNTGNVQLAGLRLSDALGDFTGRVELLEVGESRLFTSKVTISGSAVSKPRLSYTVPAEPGKEYVRALDDAKILLASEQLDATLELDREAARYGETVVATLTIANFGNVDFYDIRVTDEAFGGLIADGVEIVNGAKPLVIRREYPVRQDAEFQFRVRALSQSGAVVETLTEPVPLRVLPESGEAEISVYAKAAYPVIARGGDAPFDVYVVNAGDRALENAKLTESSTGASLWDFAVLASRTTTHRRVYVPVTEDATFAFEVSYRGQDGARRAALSPSVAISIARDGHKLTDDRADSPYSGESTKLGENPMFLFMLAGAGAVLLALTVALLLSSRRARRARKEKILLKRRLRQEELGKTNRFTPVKRPERKRKENP